MIRYNLTPKALRCTVGACPAVYELENGNLVIVGDKTDSVIHAELQGKIAPHEVATVIEPRLLDTFVQKRKSELEGDETEKV